ncbi:MAG: hypothetical protein JEZ00_08310 [Anaerolineaceae bacterium]|nr:hypothetical protein [Anaerolineaceae bacterium]
MRFRRQDQNQEMLSAYLDAQLSDDERGKVESAIKNDPELQKQLERLDATRRLLRNAPWLKVPRNFTLTEAMLPQKTPFRFWMPAMSISSALAAILLVFTYVTNLGGLGSPFLTQNRSIAQDMMTESFAADAVGNAETMEKSSTQGEPPAIIQWFGNQVNGKGGGDGSNSIIAPQAEMMAEEAISADEELMLEAPQASDMAQESDTLPLPSAVYEAEPVEGERTQEMEASAPDAPLPAPLEFSPAAEEPNGNEPSVNPILGISSEEERGQIIDENHAIQTYPSSNEDDGLNQRQSALIILRVALLLLTIIFAIVALLMKRMRA